MYAATTKVLILNKATNNIIELKLTKLKHVIFPYIYILFRSSTWNVILRISVLLETDHLCLVRHLVGMSQLQNHLFFRKLHL